MAKNNWCEGFLKSGIVSPCGKCGKWKKGCREECPAYKEFEERKAVIYEKRHNAWTKEHELNEYRKQKPWKHNATAVSKINRERRCYDDGENTSYYDSGNENRKAEQNV